jgi:YegS/Rv2252/BmrU family lipid kinase
LEFGASLDFGVWNLKFGTAFVPNAYAIISSRLSRSPRPLNAAVRVCVIFNPTAKGEKARRFRRGLDLIGKQSTLKLTSSAGEARQLAARAVQEGFQIVAAAGGDGTMNEVLNGIGDVPGGFDRVCLGVLPLGTVNVFARELSIPSKLEPAWEIIRRGRETLIDLPSVEYGGNGQRHRRYFAQLGGAGLDARAIELVKWRVKKCVGPLAYVLAGLHAVAGPPSTITVEGGQHSLTGQLVLIGNGRLYGGQFEIFPNAHLSDGLLEVSVLPRANWFTLLRCAPALLFRARLPASSARLFQAETLTLTSPSPAPLQVDGELIGKLPANFSIERSRLRVIIP